MTDEIAAFTLRVARPIIWHDRTQGWPKTLDGASCFFVRFDRGIVGITANHVVEAFEAAADGNSNIVCQLRSSPPLDLRAAVIDRDDSWDIATFGITEELFRSTEAVALDCRGDWPPPTPAHQGHLSICGFPEHLRMTTAQQTAEFRAWGALATVESVSARDILITYDPARDQPTRWAPILPPLGMNLSGCSGGPALLYEMRAGILRHFPVGVVIGGPRNTGEGASAEFDMIRLRRIDRIRSDGSIEKEPRDWLPA